MDHAQKVMNARLHLLDATVRTPLRTLTEFERKKARGGLPKWILEQAVAWLVGSEDGRAVLAQLGKIPSSETIARWWKASCADPLGMTLQPKSYAAGRERLTDKTPGLQEEILGAYGYVKSFRGAADVLRKKGHDISENTVRRVIAGLDQVVVAGLLKGERKALTDFGPYVRRRPSLPYQCWSIDGHTWDALTLWEKPLPGEELKPFRPKLYMVRDVGSGAYLSIQMGNSLNRYLVYMAIAEAIIRTGVIPESIQTDNGSEVVNDLFMGDEDTYGYFQQLGMNWKDGQALWRAALPYNSRSKPVERDFRTLSQSMAARLPAYVGGNPSRRPGDPLKAAHEAGAYETVASLKEKLAAWLQERLQTVRTVQRHRIQPLAALSEARQSLVEELGADHPRFVRQGQEWRVLPSLKGRLVRGFVEARIEGQVLRYHAPILDTLQAEGLEVRIWPWKVSKAWLCRGGAFLSELTFVPDGPELGAERTAETDDCPDVVALRYAKLLERRQRGLIKAARRGAEALQAEAGMHGIDLRPLDLPAMAAKPKPEVVDPAEMERQRIAFDQDARKAVSRVEENVDRYQRLLLRTRPEEITDEDRTWITEFEKTSEGKALRDALKDYRRDGAAR